MRRIQFSITALLLLTTAIAIGTTLWVRSMPPSETTWGDISHDLDAAHSQKMFFGKTRREAEQLFAENAISRQEDLAWMPEKCMQFYIHAYMDYLLSDQSKSDPDAASCFISLVRTRHDDIRAGGKYLVRRVDSVLVHISSNQTWYDADTSIYGDFPKLVTKCRKRLAGG